MTPLAILVLVGTILANVGNAAGGVEKTVDLIEKIIAVIRAHKSTGGADDAPLADAHQAQVDEHLLALRQTVTAPSNDSPTAFLER